MRDEHSFSIQLKNKEYVKNVSLCDDTEVLFEGYLGELESLGMIEEAILEIKGINGVLRIDLTQSQLVKLLQQDEKQ